MEVILLIKHYQQLFTKLNNYKLLTKYQMSMEPIHVVCKITQNTLYASLQ